MNDKQTLRPLDLAAGLKGAVGAPHYAIVDIGSNSVRLVVYDQLGRAPLPRYVEKLLCRLGDGVAETGRISEEGFRRTIEAMRRFQAIAGAMQVARIDVTATEAVRRAANGAELAAAIRDASGLDVRILTGSEEAHYSALGVVSGFYRPVGLMGDMGGGSLEVTEVLDDRAGETSVSLPLGALPVEAMLKSGAAAAKQDIDAMLKAGLPSAAPHRDFYAVGGGWRSLANVHMAMAKAPVPVVHGYTLEAREVRDFAKSLLRLSPAKLSDLPGLSSRRARTLPASAMVLDRLLKYLAPRTVVFSALGLREGWLYAQLAEKERYRDPLVEGARLIGLPLARVPGFAQTLLPWTDQLFPDQPPAGKRLRVAVCALSDMAWRDHADLRAEESFRRILQLPFIGIDHAERVFVAAAVHARYAGKADAPWLTPAIALLTQNQRREACILGRAILLAYRLSGSVPQLLESARLRLDRDAVILEVSEEARVPDSEVVGDRLRLLAEAAGVKQQRVIVRD